jgi:putative peptidoglycan lipid II flippase
MGGIASAAAIIFLGNVTSRLLGLAREIVIAALFGNTGATSAYRTAARLATVAYDLLISGAISAALVPVFTDYARTGDSRALARVVSVILNLLLLALGVLLLVLMLAAPAVVALLGADAAYFDLTVTLTRWALLSVLLLGVAGVLTAALYAQRDFKWPAFATAAYNVGIIAAAWALTRPYGDDRPPESIVALAIGLVLGAFLQAAIQLPGLRGLRYEAVLDWHHPGVRLALRLYAPVAAGLVVSNFGVVVDTNLAWRTGEASLAALQAATTLVQFPLGLVASAVSLAALPTLARAVPTPPPPLPAREGGATGEAEAAPPFRGEEGAAGGAGEYVATLTFAVRLVLVLILPATVGLFLLREPVVAWLFQRGAFDAVATAQTAQAFAYYAPQLPFAALDQLFIVAFYARKDTRTPVLVGVGTVLLYLATAPALCGCVDLPLVGRPALVLGRDGLALANTIQNSTHAVVLFLLLRQAFPALASRDLGSYLLRVVLAALGMGVALHALLPLLVSPPRAPWQVVLAAGLVGVLAYAALLLLLRVQEIGLLWRLLRARLGRRGPPAPPAAA